MTLIEAGWMEFDKGNIKLFRLTKIDPEHHDVIPLDMIAVTPLLQDIWSSRIHIDTEMGAVWAVSREGLIKMKRISGRKQDLADIEKLEGTNDEG